MAFVFDATTGGAAANSFATVEFADDYLGGSLYATDWPATSAGADLLTKQKALVTATRELNSRVWQGYKSDFDTQRLEFPRVGLYDRDGNSIDSTTIPEWLKEATCELALHRLQTDPDDIVAEELKQFKRLKIANVLDMEMRDGLPAEGDWPARVIELVTRYLQTAGGTRVIRA